MSDGANLGITADRALETILGDDPQPTEEERSTREKTRARLEAIPLFEGPPPWEGIESGGPDKDQRNTAYGLVADAIAHAFLILIEEDPTLLEPRLYPETYPDGSPMTEVLRGKPMDQSRVLWDAMKERWPNANEWCGGASGFQVGFAFNAALYASDRDATGNPAIIEVGTRRKG